VYCLSLSKDESLRIFLYTNSLPKPIDGPMVEPGLTESSILNASIAIVLKLTLLLFVCGLDFPLVEPLFRVLIESPFAYDSIDD